MAGCYRFSNVVSNAVLACPDTPPASDESIIVIHDAGAQSVPSHRLAHLARTVVLCYALALAGCGGGNGGNGNGDDDDGGGDTGGGDVPSDPPAYTIGGTVAGLADAGLILHNAGEDLAIADNGDFVFATTWASGDGYDVTVTQNPPLQTCTVSDSAGTVTDHDVDDVHVECTFDGNAGGLDLGFGADGVVLTDFNTLDDYGRAVVTQTDGKLIAAGYASTGASFDFAVVRYHADGTRDTSFGSDGRVTTDFAGGEDRAYAIALQSDGGIVVAGYAHVGVGIDFALARYDRDGTLDPSFGNNGKVLTDFGNLDYAQALAIDPTDDGIVVVGRALAGTQFDFALARYHRTGQPDTGFDGDGRVTTDFNGDHDFGNAVAVQSDGRIVMAGYAESGANKDFALARYNRDGTLDTTGFGTGGKVTTNFGPPGRADFGQAIAILAGGEILVAGYTFNGSNDFALARYTASGVLDTTFDTDGQVTVDVGGATDEAYAMAIDADGNIVLAGRGSNGNDFDFAIARLTAEGARDMQFGIDGILLVSIGSDNDEAYGLTIQADGKLVLAGHALIGAHTDFALLRLHDGPPPTASAAR